jgi:hypothetical protein
MSDDVPTDMVPRAELERAVAEAVAIERRKRYRVQLALAALVIAASCFTLYLDSVRQRCEDEREGESEAVRLRDEAERKRAEEAQEALHREVERAAEARR